MRLHKAVVLALIMKYFVLKIVSYSNATLSISSLPTAPQKENHPQYTPANVV